KFTDRRKPKYTWATKGGRRHWYGLDRAVAFLRAGALYLANGEPSVWACAARAVPAITICGGEGAAPSPELVAELRTRLGEAGIVQLAIRVAYDADNAGRLGAPKAVAA